MLSRFPIHCDVPEGKSVTPEMRNESTLHNESPPSEPSETPAIMNPLPRPFRFHPAKPVVAVAMAMMCGVPLVLSAAVIGTNPPTQPLTLNRVAALPAAVQPAWKTYLDRSNRQRQEDQAFLEKEMKDHAVRESIVPPEGHAARSIPLDDADSWYGSVEALRIADIVVSFQTPAGGWSKNLDMSLQPRAPGGQFAPGNKSLFLEDGDFDMPPDTQWNYVGTFDNDATTAQLRFLAKVITAAGQGRSTPYRAAFLRGFDYIFAAQYPNGGWPQVWPLQGGYHDAITYNDSAMINVLILLRDVSDGTDEFAFVPAPTRALAAASLKRGIDCILASQIIVGNHRTVWCQQHDPLTLRPVSARNYEMPSQGASESSGIMLFLMRLRDPSPEVVRAVDAAAAWFEKTRLRDVAIKWTAGGGRQLVAVPGGGSLWPRYSEIGTDRPIFGDRDKSIHNNLSEISSERQQHYSWYGETPGWALERYARWSKAHPRQKRLASPHSLN
jgi:PelA/Pel-15E family pectate lyase